MTEAISPLVPAHVDCTDLDGFMLNVERLMASELVALSSHEVIGAALMLWCRAWKQMPAASLPNDEKVMAAFARLPLQRFRKLRDEVLRGFVLCSDGRLYHRTLAVEALNAYERKLAFQRKRGADAERLRNWRSCKRDETPPETQNETQGETRFVAEGQGQGQGQGQGMNTAISDEMACPRPPAEAIGSSPRLSLVEPKTPPEGPVREPPYAPPECPHQRVLALWAEVLPSMPQHSPEHWRGTRADHLRARWRETAVAKQWPDEEAGLAYLRKLFAYCAKSPFLMRQTTPSAGRRPFSLELEWLVSPGNWARVHEGKYHEEQSA